MTSSNHASTQWLSQFVMKTHVTWRRWQHSTTSHCEKSWMIIPWKRLKLWKRNWLCLGTTMKSKVCDRRKAERQWLQQRGDPIKNVTCREEYRLVRNRYRSATDKAKTEYYSAKVQECAGDQKKLFEIIQSLTKPLQQEQYPDSDSLKDLADAFGDFFIMKIQKIRTKLDSQNPEPITIPRVPVKEEDMFLSFQPLSEDDVRKLIKQSPNKQCSSDPIPTWLLKECLDSLLPVLTLLVNKSLQIGYFPEEWKNAAVKPLLKKLGLELVFLSFRPVSNLPFISKLTEKASVNQLSDHMNKVRPLPSGQSAYRPSTIGPISL